MHRFQLYRHIFCEKLYDVVENPKLRKLRKLRKLVSATLSKINFTFAMVMLGGGLAAVLEAKCTIAC